MRLPKRAPMNDLHTERRGRQKIMKRIRGIRSENIDEEQKLLPSITAYPEKIDREQCNYQKEFRLTNALLKEEEDKRA